MTADWTVIGAEEPTFQMITDALVVTVPDLTLRRKAQDTLLEILDDADMPILALEAPRLIHLPEESLRLLSGAPVSAPAGGTVPMFFAPGGSGGPGDPLWWLEIHALGTRPDSGQLADRLSHALAGLCSGVVLSPFSEPSNA